VPDANRIRTLTEKALEEFDSGKPVSALVRQAHRIASLRHDYAAQVWFEFQQRELGVSIAKDDPVLLALRGKLIALLGKETAHDEYLRQYTRWESSRKMFDSENIHPKSVARGQPARIDLNRRHATSLNASTDGATQGFGMGSVPGDHDRIRVGPLDGRVGDFEQRGALRRVGSAQKMSVFCSFQIS
jgi:hypothetical protein